MCKLGTHSLCGCCNNPIVFTYDADIWSIYSSARTALLFYLITYNVLHYLLKAIPQGLQAFILSMSAFLLIILICSNENIH